MTVPSPPLPSFAEQSAVRVLDDHRYASTIAEGWDIHGVPNGGYVTALALRAVMAASPHPDPLALSTHYLRPAQPGPVEIVLQPGRQGRTLATFSATLCQGGKEIIRSTATLGTFPGEPAAPLVSTSPPALIEPARAVVAPRDLAPAFVARLDMRHDPRWAGFLTGDPAGEPKMAGWLALHDDEELDACAVTLFADAMPPTIFNTDLAPGWTPTVELTVHYHRAPQSPRIACTYTTYHVGNGVMTGDVELWDEAGFLVAEARQLALLPRAG